MVQFGLSNSIIEPAFRLVHWRCTQIEPRPGSRGTGRASERWAIMDTQTKREIWLLAIGTALVELPIAIAAFAIISH